MAASSIGMLGRLALLGAVLGLTACLYFGVGTEAAELHRLTDASDLIVIGDLTVNAPAENLPGIANGTIRGRKLIWGDPINFMLGSDASDLVYEAMWESTGDPLLSNTGLWFITTSPSGLNVLEGWAEKSRLVAVRHRLVDQMVLARLLGHSSAGSPIVQLLVRNAHPGDIQVPDFRYSGGALYLHPDVTLSLYANNADEPLMLDPLPGRQVMLGETDWSVLLSGEQKSVIVDLESVWGQNALEADRLFFKGDPYGDFELNLKP